MKRKGLWIGVAVLALVGAFLASSGGHPVRQLVALLRGADAIAYAGPRMHLHVQPGPSQPRVSPGEAGLDPAALAAAVQYAGARNTRAIVIGRGGHIVFERYWGDTTFESPLDASGFTPALAALLTGVALNERAIPNLDVPVSRYLTEWQADPRGAITLQQLLAGESGFASAAGWPWPGTRSARYHVGGALQATLLGWPLDAAQRAGEAPADVDADVLSLVLVRALNTGQAYDGLISYYLWKPLGAGGFSISHGDIEGPTHHTRAGCCLRARIGDWMRIGELLANDGVFEGNQLMPPGFVARMLKPARAQSSIGYFTRVDGKFATPGVARLEAAGKQRLWIVPSLKLVILRAGAEPAGDQGWDESMIPDTIIRGTSGWRPAAGEGTDPNQFAPH